jgi:hypothetical protein
MRNTHVSNIPGNPPAVHADTLLATFAAKPGVIW